MTSMLSSSLGCITLSQQGNAMRRPSYQLRKSRDQGLVSTHLLTSECAPGHSPQLQGEYLVLWTHGELAWVTKEITSAKYVKTRKSANEYASDVTIPWHLQIVSDWGRTVIAPALRSP